MYRTTVSSLAIALSAPAVAQETTGPDDGEVRAEQIADERRENPVDSIIVVGGRIDPYRIAGSADLIDSEDLRQLLHALTLDRTRAQLSHGANEDDAADDPAMGHDGKFQLETNRRRGRH